MYICFQFVYGDILNTLINTILTLIDTPSICRLPFNSIGRQGGGTYFTIDSTRYTLIKERER